MTRGILLLIALLALPMAAYADSIDVTFDLEDQPWGPGEPLILTDSYSGLQVVVSRFGQEMEIVELPTAGDPAVAPFGHHSLSTFGTGTLPLLFEILWFSPADPLTPEYYVEAFSFDIGDYLESDRDEFSVATTDIYGTTKLGTGTLEAPLGFPENFFSRTITTQRAFPITEILLDATSPGNPGSVFWDNFSFRLSTADSFSGVDIPETDYGGGGIGAEAGFSGANPTGDQPPIPEPGTLALVGVSVLGLAILRRRRRQ